MRSDERKDNQTNSLLFLLERTRQRMQGRILYAVVGSIVLIAALIGLYYYWQAGQRHDKAQRYVSLYDADSVEKLDEIIRSAPPDSNVVTFAKLQKARLALFRDGIEKLGTIEAKQFDQCVARIEEGRKLYKDIVNDLKTEPALAQEAWLSCAKAEQSLLGVPKAKSSAEFLGSYDEMLKDYDSAAAINPDSEASKGYVAAAAKLRENRSEIEQFYTRLNNLRFVATLKTGP